MTVLCLGSINIDHVYRVDHLPQPGETTTDDGYAIYLGGKGANMSIAAAMSGGEVSHVGAVGSDGKWCLERLQAVDIDISETATVSEVTGHAVIFVDRNAENSIVIHPGANRQVPRDAVLLALGRRSLSDWLLVQNETNLVVEAAHAAKAKGMRVAYAAAPFDPIATTAVLPDTDLLAVNAIEARQLAMHLGVSADQLPVPAVVITEGAEGARYRGPEGEIHQPAFPVVPVDTTGAGDTFLGVFLAALDQGQDVRKALQRAAAAAAIQVTRPGAADAIPTAEEIDAFLKDHA
ncbi:MAG: ribokinase [Pseudomonadota bacterium]